MSSFEIEDRLSNASPPAVASPSANRFSYLRRWRRPRPLAWAVVLVIGSVLAYGQFLRVEQHHKTPSPSCSVGWPYPYAWTDSPSGPLDHIRWRSLAGDVGWWFAMIIPVLIVAERLARRRRRGVRPSAKTLISVVAAAAMLSMWTDWMSLYHRFDYEPGLAVFELALLGVSFCWLHMVALGVTNSFSTVWERSSHLLTVVASYAFIGVTVIGFDLWLYSNGFMRSDNDLWEWLHWTMFFGAGVTLLFGSIVWLTGAARKIIDNYRNVSRSDSH